MEIEEKSTDKNEVSIDLQRIFGAVLNKIWLVALVAILCAVATFVSTFYFVTPQYSVSSMFYVNNSNFSIGDTSLSISAGDITAAKDLVSSYIVILKTRETINDVIDYAGVDCTYGEVYGMISAGAVNSTEIFRVVVTTDDPELSTEIAHAIEEIFPNRIKKIIEGTSAKVVESAVKPAGPSSPNYANNTAIGLMIGLIAVVAIIVLKELFDTKIHTDEDVKHVCPYPILASVPDMVLSAKSGYYDYGYTRANKRSFHAGNSQEAPKLVGADISFSAAEAYKRLRTKLQFSFSDDSNSRVIGVSSAMTGEGKSTTAINLAYTLAQLNKKVVLVDCDMRRPTLASKLSIEKNPGLSSYLSGQTHMDTLVQKCIFANDEYAFDAVSAGRNPPNPIELLSSERMSRVLGKLREKYDYIVLDLPPVGEVSDAMAVADLTDGMLLVVRQHYANRNALADTVHQFSFVNAKILGVVFNSTTEGLGKYGYRKYYKRYYRSYHKKYEGSYAAKKKSAKYVYAESDKDE